MLNLSKKNVTAALSAIVLLFALFIFVYFPALKEIRKKNVLWKGLSEQLKNVEGLRDFQKTGINKRLISRQELSWVLDKITEMAKARFINFKSITQEQIMALNGYRVLPVRIELEGDYKQLGLFSGDLENIQDALVTVENFQVNPVEKALPRILSFLTLNIYLAQD